MRYRDYLESKGLGHHSIANYERYLLHYASWTEQEGIETEFSSYREVLGYVHYLQKKELSMRTIQFYLAGLNYYFKWIVSRELRKDNPIENIDIKGVKRRSLYTILPKETLEKLYNDYRNRTPSTASHKRNCILLSLMIYQGLGSLELSRLEVKDVQLREGIIHIKRTRKTNGRDLKLYSHQVLDLMEYQLQTRHSILETTGEQTTSYFVSFTKTTTNFSNIMYQFMKDIKRNYKAITSANQIRTSVIVGWLKQYNLREVQYRAGHRYVSSTEAYLVHDVADLKQEIEKYHPLQ